METAFAPSCDRFSFSRMATNGPPTYFGGMAIPHATAFSIETAPPNPYADGDGVVWVIAGQGTEEWAPAAVIHLAGTWGADTTLVLVNAHLGGSPLDARLGLRPEEGLTDFLEFGSSLARVVRPEPGGRFHFISAGTPVYLGETPFASLRWKSLLRQLRDSGSSVLVFIAGEDAPQAFREWGDKGRSVALGLEPGVLEKIGKHTSILAVFTAPSALPQDGEDRELADPLLMDPLYGRGTEKPPGPSPAEGAAEHPEERPTAGPKPRIWRFAPVQWAVAAVVFVVGGFLLQIRLSPRGSPAVEEGVGAAQEDGGGAEAETGGVEGGAGASATGLDGAPRSAPWPDRAPPPPLSFSVGVASFSDPARADREAEALRETVPGLPAFVVPVEVNGRTYHRVLLGAASDSAGAHAILDQIIAAVGRDPSRFVIRSTPLAFRLAVASTAAEAERQARDLHARGVPAYVFSLPVIPDPGGPGGGEDSTDAGAGFAVYAGAYETPAEASYLAEFLERLGIEATLGERVGSPLS
ncbi:MAG: SPOR domain-containing protein [Gemmatimonadota bacterium]